MAFRRFLLASALLVLALLSTLTIPSVRPGPAEASNAAQVATGDNHACALLSAGTVKCWGSNSSGQLGDGTTTTRYTPVDVCATGATPPCNAGNSNILTGVTAITAGGDHTCALITGGGVKCWGYNGEGGLGDGTTTDRHTPVDVCAVGAGAGCGPNSINAPDTTGSVGRDSSLALDPSGFPVISYYDISNLNLKVLHCGNVNCTSGNSLASPDTTNDVGQYTSLALYGGAFPVVSYYDVTNGDLKLLHCGNANCSSGNDVTTVDDGVYCEFCTADVGWTSSLALDGSGYPVISYYDRTNGDLKVVHCGNPSCTSGNTKNTPDTGGDVGSGTSLALDGSGKPVVAYYDDAANGDLKVLHCGNTTCSSGNSITSPDTTGDVGQNRESLTLDASGFPVVAYYDNTNHDLKVLHCGNANCTASNTISSPDTGGDVGTDTSLRLDGAGRPVISYRDANNSDLKVLHCGNATCTAGNVMTSPDTVGNVGSYGTALRLDASGLPVVSYWDATNGDLKVLHCGTTNCNGAALTGALAIAAGAFHTCALISGGGVECWGKNSNGQLGDNNAPNNSNTPVPVCADPSCSSFLGSVASVVGGGYHTCALISGGTVKCWGLNSTGQLGDGTTTERDVPVNVVANSITAPDTGSGFDPSLALDGSGHPVVSYNVSNSDLKVLHCGNANCTAGNSLTSPDTGGNVGHYSSLALDSGGNPVVSYLDAGNGDLKVMHCNDPNCAGADESISSPDTTGAVGYFTSLALDSSGNPVVSYSDVTNDALKVLHCGNPNCTSSNVFTTVDAWGWYTSLVLDASGHPVISYFDHVGGFLKVVHCGDTTCSSGNQYWTPDSSGGYTSLRLDASGYPVVSYYDSTNGNLKVLHCGNAGCSSGNTYNSPDTTGDVGQFTSLRLDASGRPVISYLDVTSSDLKVLHCGDANCSAGNTINSPDTVGLVGYSTSLALDTSGSPVVAYYDASNDDLKVLHCGLASCASTLSGVTSIGAGLNHSCAVVTNGGVKCWGDNSVGQLGNGTTGGSADTPIMVCGNSTCSAHLSGAIFVAAGSSHTCAIVLSGRAKCWGQNADGELGDGTNADSDTPRDVCKGMPDGTWAPTPAPGPGCDTLATGFSSGDLGAYFGCFATTVGNVRCWGDNSYGELGTAAAMPDSNTPSNVYYQLSTKVGVITITSPDTAGDVGAFTSLALDSAGNPVVSYNYGSGGDLKVLRCGNTTCTLGNSTVSADTPGNVGGFTSLALVGPNRPVVSYYDFTNQDLKVLSCGDTTCNSGQIYQPDTVGDVGEYTSLAVDSSGRPVVSYYDLTNGNLKVLHCGSGDCSSSNSITSPDAGVAGANVGQFTSLALDGSGDPVVSYYDITNGDLKVLHCGSANCSAGNSITTPDTTGDTGKWTSLTLDGSGNPVVAYRDNTSGYLKLLHCNDANCAAGGDSITTLDTVSSYDMSVKLDSSGSPVVSYHDGTNGDLRLAHCTNANCTSGHTIASPDTGGLVGQFSSLALDNTGIPVIAYYDATNGNLKVLRCGDPNCAGAIPVSTITGTGVAGDSPSGTAAASAQVDDPTGLSQSSMALYFADTTNCEVKKIESGFSYTLAGTGAANCGYSSEGTATSAELNLPRDVFLKGSDLYIADTENCRIRTISGVNISTVAGNGTCTGAIDGPGGNTADDVIDGGSPLSTSLGKPKGVAVDGSGNIYIADTENCRIRKVSGGSISTIAGTGVCAFAGDGGPATAAQLNKPTDVAFLLPGDDLVIADTGSNRIRRYSMSTGSITTIAGSGSTTFNGDGGQATSASLSSPEALTAIDNRVLIADTQHNRIRRVNILTGVIDTIVGVGGQTGSYALSLPQGVAVVAGGGGGGAGAAAGQGEAAGPGTTPVTTTFANSGMNFISSANTPPTCGSRGCFRPTTSCSVTPHVSSIDFAILPVMLGLIGFRRRLRVLFITLRSILTPKRRSAAPVPTL